MVIILNGHENVDWGIYLTANTNHGNLGNITNGSDLLIALMVWFATYSGSSTGKKTGTLFGWTPSNIPVWIK